MYYSNLKSRTCTGIIKGLSQQFIISNLKMVIETEMLWFHMVLIHTMFFGLLWIY